MVARIGVRGGKDHLVLSSMTHGIVSLTVGLRRIEPREPRIANIAYPARLMAISARDVTAMGKDPEQAVHLPNELQSRHEDGVVVSADVAHQLHCLVRLDLDGAVSFSRTDIDRQNLVRMYTYSEYYYALDPMPVVFRQNSATVLRKHIGKSTTLPPDVVATTDSCSRPLYRHLTGKPNVHGRHRAHHSHPDRWSTSHLARLQSA
jgi:hypothetical protein